MDPIVIPKAKAERGHYFGSECCAGLSGGAGGTALAVAPWNQILAGIECMRKIGKA